MSTQGTACPKLFIGMDIHKNSWKLHFCTDLTIGSGKTFPPKPEDLCRYVQNYYPKHLVTIAYEVGCCGYTAARQFMEYGWDTYVVNPADIPRPAKLGVVKTDKIDARNIATQLRAGNLKKLTIPSVDRECLRSLTRRRTNLVKDFRKIKLQIKSILLYYNVEIPEKFDNANWSKDFLQFLKNLKWNYLTIDKAFVSLMKHIDFLDGQIKDVSTSIRAYCRKYYHKDYTLLRSVPGIGPLTAAYILAEVGDLRRFNSFKQFTAYIGILPNLYSSGENTRALGVNPRANRTIRSLIIESSWVAIRIDPALQQYYRKHVGLNPKACIFKVARKLLSRIHSVIKTETEYALGVIQ